MLASIEFLTIFLCFGLSWAYTNYDCTGKPDGIYEYTCFYYLKCENGYPKQVNCKSQEVYDPAQQTCVVPGPGYWPCSDVKNCEQLQDNSYPDYSSGCKTFYTCHNSFYYGHTFCPGDLVFDWEQQLCNRQNNVLIPCGNAIPIHIQ